MLINYTINDYTNLLGKEHWRAVNHYMMLCKNVYMSVSKLKRSPIYLAGNYCTCLCLKAVDTIGITQNNY